jgi:acetone carboxylase gamma subunit
MKYRPDIWLNKREFVCSDCGEVYVVSGDGPGQYWETKIGQIEQLEELLSRTTFPSTIEYLKREIEKRR